MPRRSAAANDHGVGVSAITEVSTKEVVTIFFFKIVYAMISALLCAGQRGTP
jgi:hypothetical protein